MKHCSKTISLSLKKDQYKALLKAQAEALILHEKITTTQAKAKVLKPWLEKMVTRAKKSDLTSLRLLRRSLSQNAVKKLLGFARQRYQDRPGGYLRIIKLPPRQHDQAAMAVISFVE